MRRKPSITVLVFCFTFVTRTMAAAILLEVAPPPSVFVGRSFEVSVVLSSDNPMPIGGYGATLRWPASICPLVGWSAGSGPTALSSPVVNDGDAATGVLRFSAADPAGDNGRIELLRMTFAPVGVVGSICDMEPDLTSVYEAATFEDRLPSSAVVPGVSTIRDSRDSMIGFQNPAGTAWSWVPVDGATSYDVARGDRANLSGSSLGPVVCVENDSADTTTAGGYEVAVSPAPGAAWFFLFRIPGEGYGTNSAGVPRAPGPGDCP